MKIIRINPNKLAKEVLYDPESDRFCLVGHILHQGYDVPKEQLSNKGCIYKVLIDGPEWLTQPILASLNGPCTVESELARVNDQNLVGLQTSIISKFVDLHSGNKVRIEWETEP